MGVGSVWLPIVVCLAMLALVVVAPCCWDDGNKSDAELTRRRQR